MQMINRFGDMDNPLEGEGIVLTDELGMHFHPDMQSKILPMLREIFPCCQFIVSTNSPHVVNHVRAENVFMLEKGENGIIWEEYR